MIKIDVLVKEKKWKKYIANPKKYLIFKTNKIKKLIPQLKNKKVSYTVLLTGNRDIKNLEIKIKPRMYYLFLFTKRMN